MDRLRSAGSSAMDFAKQNPIRTFVGVATFVVVVLALVLFRNLSNVKLDKITDTDTKKKVESAQKSAKGLLVMALISAIAFGVAKHKKMI